MSILTRTEPIEINKEVAERLTTDAEFRNRFIRRWAQDEIASQIRSLREFRGLNQKQLAALSGTGQSAISRSEQAGYSGWTVKTLVALAQALRARLVVSFEPIEHVAGRYCTSGEAASTETISSISNDALASMHYTDWAVVQFGATHPERIGSSISTEGYDGRH